VPRGRQKTCSSLENCRPTLRKKGFMPVRDTAESKSSAPDSPYEDEEASVPIVEKPFSLGLSSAPAKPSSPEPKSSGPASKSLLKSVSSLIAISPAVPASRRSSTSKDQANKPGSSSADTMSDTSFSTSSRFSDLAAKPRGSSVENLQNGKVPQMSNLGKVPNVDTRSSILGTRKSSLIVRDPRSSVVSTEPSFTERLSNLSAKASSLGVNVQNPASPSSSSLSPPSLPPGKPKANNTQKPAAPATFSKAGLPANKPKPAHQKDRAESGLNDQEQYMLNKAILSIFLEDQAPDRIDMTDELLNEFKGREETLFEKLTNEFPDVDALHSAESTDSPAWDKFAQRRKQRQSQRGFFGTASPSLGVDDDVRVVFEKTTNGAKKNRFSTSKKKSDTSRSIFGKLKGAN